MADHEERPGEAEPVLPTEVSLESPLSVTAHAPTTPEPPALMPDHDAESSVEPVVPAEAAEEPVAAEPAAAGEVVAGETDAPEEVGAGEPGAAGETPPAEEAPPAPIPSKKRWYVVKVQSGREDSIKENIERRMRIEGLEEFFGQIVIPVESVTEMRNNRRVTKHHKLYPGYLMAEVEYNDRILYLFRETSGVGDFVGGTVTRPPNPMSTNEVEKMLGIQQRKKDIVKPKAPSFARGDRLRVKKGTFAGMEGELVNMMEEEAKVELTLTIFGRPVAMQIDYWDVEPA